MIDDLQVLIHICRRCTDRYFLKRPLLGTNLKKCYVSIYVSLSEN